MKKSFVSKKNTASKTHNLPKAKKRFGQNFLIDETVIDAIIGSCDVDETDTVLEIGPGTGALTKRLAQKAAKVVAVEIDTSLKDKLEKELSEFDNIEILFCDILKIDLNELVKTQNNGKPFKVVANLPYYISTPVIMKLLRADIPPLSCTVMVQKELGDRMAASPGGKEYGDLSVTVRYYADPKKIIDVPPNSFIPAPKVDSVVLKLKPKEKAPVNPGDKEFFFKVVEASFAHRRKTLVNSLSSAADIRLEKERIVSALNELKEKYPDINENIRAEKLSIFEFCDLSDILNR